jgi:hypothetical protein
MMRFTFECPIDYVRPESFHESCEYAHGRLCQTDIRMDVLDDEEQISLTSTPVGLCDRHELEYVPGRTCRLLALTALQVTATTYLEIVGGRALLASIPFADQRELTASITGDAVMHIGVNEAATVDVFSRRELIVGRTRCGRGAFAAADGCSCVIHCHWCVSVRTHGGVVGCSISESDKLELMRMLDAAVLELVFNFTIERRKRFEISISCALYGELSMT